MMEHVFFCMATHHRCRFCEITGHLEKCTNKNFPQRQKEFLQRLKSRENAQGMRRVNYIDEAEEEEEEESEEEEEQLVLRANEEVSKPF